MDSDLDNPFWSSLRSRHRDIAQVAGEAARFPAEYAPFLDALYGLERENPHFTFVPTMTRMDDSHASWTGETGRLDACEYAVAAWLHVSDGLQTARVLVMRRAIEQMPGCTQVGARM